MTMNSSLEEQIGVGIFTWHV